MNLREQLEAKIKQFVNNRPQEIQDIFRDAAEDLEKHAPKGLIAGQTAPNFTLPSANGEAVTLYDELKKGPVILTFYRGAWCPYCNLELKAYQELLPQIKQRGAQILAVSPQTPDSSLTMKEKNELQFHLLSDKGNQVSNEYNLTFKMQKVLIELYQKLALELPSYNGEDSWELPLAATFVISQQAKIIYAYVDTDYRKRAEPSEVLEYLPN
ncbi:MULTISPECIES: peroxiredoxin-like family protein [Bacillales]|uniref:peroxiredoxin-like family protein n=1 Tax=Bacillales TaxID=1385 RepID=UPI001E286703|nr:peroxiredoxin-like family protein [Metabacillus sp. B2-18]UGB30980.1 AhpC/TSA family protein [Metabacillus sp. B2-18]